MQHAERNQTDTAPLRRTEMRKSMTRVTFRVFLELELLQELFCEYVTDSIFFSDV